VQAVGEGMIYLSPREVEACRRLKAHTEKELAEELYSTIAGTEYPEFMKHVREMCRDTLGKLKEIVELLQASDIKDKDQKAINIDKMLQEAGPLSVYFALDKAQKDEEINKHKQIEEVRDEKIKVYKDLIRKFEEAERDLNNNINKLLLKISAKKASGDDFDKCKIKEEEDFKKNCSLETTKETIENYNKLLNEGKGKPKEELTRQYIIEGKSDKEDGYFELKKHLDIEINLLYHKVEWQKEYAEGLKRNATAELCQKKLKCDHLDQLIKKYSELSPSDCSDIFRLFGTMMEELDKLTEDNWEKLREQAKKKTESGQIIDVDQLKFVIQLQGVLRETSGLSAHQLFPQMPQDLARYVRLPNEYLIDRGERFVKYCEECKGIKQGDKKQCTLHPDAKITDGIEQSLTCKVCGWGVKKVFEAGKHSREKSIKMRCERCKKETDFAPIEGIKPFWKDEIRARWRDTWSATFILEYNSVVRAIDRTFGLPEGADISGTTADSIFGMESILYLEAQGKTISTQKEASKLNDLGWSQKYPGEVILLPLITMVKHGHHALLECALTFMLTGYIDAYHIGKYTSLWPKGSGGGPLLTLLKKYEDSPSNMRIIIERDKMGFVTGGWLFGKNDSLGKYSFEDITKLNYQRYINIFLPLRDRMRKGEYEITAEYIYWMMQYSDLKLDALMYEILEETAKRLKKDGGTNYNKFKKELKKHALSKKTNGNVNDKLRKIYAKYK
jgi:hypothetical protein